MLGLYADLFGYTIGQAAAQLRSREGLQSALARPQFYAHYDDADVAHQAAVLAHGIAESQPFIDGNKRTALLAMATFLEANSFELDVAEPDLAAWILQLSQGLTLAELAERIRASLRPLPE